MAGFWDNFRSAASPTPFAPDMGMSGIPMGGDVSAMAGWGAPPTVAPTVVPSTLGSGVGVAAPATGAMGGVGALRPAGKLGFNMDTANLALTGLNTVGNLWAAFQAQKLAKQQFNYTKQITDTNLENQLKTYNTALTDRANNRAIVEGRTPAETQNYIDMNKLSRYGR